MLVDATGIDLVVAEGEWTVTHLLLRFAGGSVVGGNLCEGARRQKVGERRGAGSDYQRR